MDRAEVHRVEERGSYAQGQVTGGNKSLAKKSNGAFILRICDLQQLSNTEATRQTAGLALTPEIMHHSNVSKQPQVKEKITLHKTGKPQLHFMEMQLEQGISPLWGCKLLANESLRELMSTSHASHGADKAKQRSI